MGDFVEFLQFLSYLVVYILLFSQSGNLPLFFSLLRAVYDEISRHLCSAWGTVLCDILAVHFFSGNIFVLILTLSLFIFH